MLRPILLALAGVALAALLALGVFFASEAALGDDEPVLEPALVSTTNGRTTTERRTTSAGTTTEDRPTTPVPTIRTETDDDGGGRGRGRGRGRGGNSGPGGADDD